MADIAGPGAHLAPDGVVDVHDLLKTLSGYSKAHAKNPEADVDRNADVDAHDVLHVVTTCTRPPQTPPKRGRSEVGGKVLSPDGSSDRTSFGPPSHGY